MAKYFSSNNQLPCWSFIIKVQKMFSLEDPCFLRNVFFVIPMLFVCDSPLKWNSFPSGPSTTKSKDTGGMCMDNVHKKFGEKIGSLVCIWGFNLWGQSIGGYVLKDIVKYIFTPCYLYYVHTFLSELTHLIDWFVSTDGSAVLNW